MEGNPSPPEVRTRTDGTNSPEITGLSARPGAPRSCGVEGGADGDVPKSHRRYSAFPEPVTPPGGTGSPGVEPPPPPPHLSPPPPLGGDKQGSAGNRAGKGQLRPGRLEQLEKGGGGNIWGREGGTSGGAEGGTLGATAGGAWGNIWAGGRGQQLGEQLERGGRGEGNRGRLGSGEHLGEVRGVVRMGGG